MEGPVPLDIIKYVIAGSDVTYTGSLTLFVNFLGFLLGYTIVNSVHPFHMVLKRDIAY